MHVAEYEAMVQPESRKDAAKGQKSRRLCEPPVF